MRIHATLVCLSLAACGTAPSVRFETHRVGRDLWFEAAPRILEVRLRHGYVRVHPGAELAGRVELEVGQRYGAQAQALAESAKLLAGDDPDHRILAVLPPNELELDAYHVLFDLTVPADVELRIVSTSGDVALRGFAGTVAVRTVAGRVTADLSGGRIQVTSERGATRIGGEFEAAHVSAGSGRVELQLPRRLDRVEGVEVVSGSGDVRLLAGAEDLLGIEFATERGMVFSELPVAWRDEPRPNGSAVHYRGVLGSREVALARDPVVRVRSATGNLHVETLAMRPDLPLGTLAADD